jgi:hypothetical protein
MTIVWMRTKCKTPRFARQQRWRGHYRLRGFFLQVSGIRGECERIFRKEFDRPFTIQTERSIYQIWQFDLDSLAACLRWLHDITRMAELRQWTDSFANFTRGFSPPGSIKVKKSRARYNVASKPI